MKKGIVIALSSILLLFIVAMIPYLFVSFAIWEFPLEFAKWHHKERSFYLTVSLLFFVPTLMSILAVTAKEYWG